MRNCPSTRRNPRSSSGRRSPAKRPPVAGRRPVATRTASASSRYASPVGEGDGRGRGGAGDAGSGEHLHPVLPELRGQTLAQLPLQGGQGGGGRLQNGDAGACGGPDTRQLHPDHSAADDGQTVQGTQIGQQAVAGDYTGCVQAGDGGQGGLGARGDQDVGRLVGRAPASHRVGAGDHRPVRDELPPRRPGAASPGRRGRVDTTRSTSAARAGQSQPGPAPWRRALVGTHPRLRQVPPTWRGLKGATDRPPCAARRAAAQPPGPPADDNQLIHGSALREGVPAPPGGGRRRSRRGGPQACSPGRRGGPPAPPSPGAESPPAPPPPRPASRGLGLGRLEHQRLVDDQGEIHGGRVDARVQHGLGHVQGGYPRLLFSSSRVSTNSCMHRPGKAAV